MSEKEFTRVYTVAFVVSTNAKNEKEAHERIDRVFCGTITDGLADENGLLDKIWGTFDNVTCEMLSSTGSTIVARSADDVGRALVDEHSNAGIDLPRILASADLKKKLAKKPRRAR